MKKSKVIYETENEEEFVELMNHFRFEETRVSENEYKVFLYYGKKGLAHLAQIDLKSDGKNAGKVYYSDGKILIEVKIGSDLEKIMERFAE